MSNVTIAGASTSTTTPLPITSTIDGVNDYLPIYTASATATQAINRQTFLGVSGQPVDVSSTQTLTGKSLTAPAISAPVLSGTITGTYTIGGTPTFPASVVTLTGSQTLTNKTLTSPAINGGTVDNITLTVDSIAGHTASNVGTLYGVSFNAGTLTGLANGTISGANLSSSAIALGYNQIAAPFATSATTAAQVTGLTSTVTVPAGGRKVKITFNCSGMYVSTAAVAIFATIWDGVVGAGTQLARGEIVPPGTSQPQSTTVIAIVTPAAGSKTYNVGLHTSNAADAANIDAAATYPAFILVEAI